MQVGNKPGTISLGAACGIATLLLLACDRGGDVL
jgi:hypothetical protein